MFHIIRKIRASKREYYNQMKRVEALPEDCRCFVLTFRGKQGKINWMNFVNICMCFS